MSNIPINGTLAANGDFPIVDGYITVGSFTAGSLPPASTYPAGTMVYMSDDNVYKMTDGAAWTTVGSGVSGGAIHQVAVYQDSSTLEGFSNFIFDGTTLGVDKINSLGSPSFLTIGGNQTVGSANPTLTVKNDGYDVLQIICGVFDGVGETTSLELDGISPLDGSTWLGGMKFTDAHTTIWGPAPGYVAHQTFNTIPDGYGSPTNENLLFVNRNGHDGYDGYMWGRWWGTQHATEYDAFDPFDGTTQQGGIFFDNNSTSMWGPGGSAGNFDLLADSDINLNATNIWLPTDNDHKIAIKTTTGVGYGNNLTIQASDGYGTAGRSGGSVKLVGGVGSDGNSEAGIAGGGSVFLDGGQGGASGESHGPGGLVIVNYNGNTTGFYCGTDILLYPNTGPLDDSEVRSIGFGTLTADNYANGRRLNIQGCEGGFAQSFPGGNAGSGGDIFVIGGTGGTGNNFGVGGLAGPGGSIWLTAGSGGIGGNSSSRANGGDIHINSGGAGFGGADGYVYIGDGHMRGLSFFGVTPMVGQFSATGSTTVTSAGSGTALKADTTSTGGIGATAYTVSDIIKALKLLGLIAQ